jgi:hypothetical protein
MDWSLDCKRINNSTTHLLPNIVYSNDGSWKKQENERYVRLRLLKNAEFRLSNNIDLNRTC